MTHPSFMFTGPASGGAKSISARPTRAEKTLTSTTYLQHLERAKSHVREELGSSLKQVCNYEANPRYCTFANSWSTPCREHSTCLYLCTVLLLRLVHET